MFAPNRSSLRVDTIAAVLGSRVVRAADVEQLGVPRSTVLHRCRAGGPWQRLLPGILLLHNGPPTRDDRRRAALLYAGDDSVITGLDALDLQGMRRMPAPSGPVTLLVPADRRRGGVGRVRVERTDRLPVPKPGRWPLAEPARAALDFCRTSNDRTIVRATLAEVVQRGVATPSQLNAELAAGSQRGSRLPREVLLEISDGVRSAAEAPAREIALRCGLPRPLFNPKLYDVRGRFIASPDVWWDDVGLAWEIDSKEWHVDPADYERTVERRSAMMATGIVVVHTLPKKLHLDPTGVREELRLNHHHAGMRPRPEVLAVPRQ